MPSLTSFISLSLDGCYADANGAMSWAHNQDPEQAEFTRGNAQGESRLMFGRTTYEMMASFWPTPAAIQMMPEVASAMNESPKIVASRTLTSASWQNTTIATDLIAGARKLKSDSGPGIAILGSGSIVATPGSLPHINPTGNAQLATAGTGDVLAGMVGAALAAGRPAPDAALTAVWHHGTLADQWPAKKPLTASKLAQSGY
mgnify:CR=1 FL=1